MRGAVGIDPRLGREGRRVAGIGLDDGGVAEVRGLLGGRRKLRAELTEGEELRAIADETEGRDVPEGGRPTITQDHLIAVGQGKQIRQARAESTHLRLDGLLPMRGAEVGAGDIEQAAHLLPAHL